MSNIENVTNIEVINAIVEPLVINASTDINGDLNVSGTIIGDILDPIHSVDEIEALSNNFIQINNTIKMNDEKIYITDDLITPSNNDCKIHIRDVNDVCLFMESDTDNLVETDNPFIIMTQDGGNMAQRIGIGGGGLNNTLMFDQSTALPATAPDGYKFTIANNLTVNGQGIPPTFNAQTTKFEINNTLNKSYQNFDMNNNNIVNINDIELETITANTTNIAMNNNINMQANDILNCNQLNVSSIADISGGAGPVVSYADIDLLNNDITSVSNITSEFYNTTNVNNKRSIYTISAKAIAMNTDTLLNNWTTVLSSSRVNVNPTTGVFAPVAGLYTLTYQASITTISVASKLGARLVDDLGNTVYESVIDSSNLFSAETGKDGSQFENLCGYFDGTRTYTIHCKINGNETMDFQAVISRIM